VEFDFFPGRLSSAVRSATAGTAGKMAYASWAAKEQGRLPPLFISTALPQIMLVFETAA
jgi:hypothetical protein